MKFGSRWQYVTRHQVGIILGWCLLSLAPGCASIDWDYPRAESTALPPAGNTAFIQAVVREEEARPGQSGFYPLSDGIDALAARLVLTERALSSIDVQYYLIKNDITGRALLRSLLRAAERSVRVRLLLDDVFTKGYDAGMAALHSHPNFEIRIFNPFSRGFAGRSVGAATSFSRINRRMHNKSFTVDNRVTVIGGRNIADEYFGAREDAKFSDLDVLAVGPVVTDVSNMFDSYWNHETAIPVPAFAGRPEDPEAELDQLRNELETAVEAIRASKYAAALVGRAYEYLDSDASIFDWAPYSLVYDSPDKGVRKRADEAESITTPLIESLASAEQEVVIVSPYFVPRKTGIERILDLHDRGVDVSVITNSLAANNQFMVHGGYAPSRKPLLKGGIKLFEVRPDADVAGTEFVDASGAKATLHTKAFIVDRREVFIGSFNFDPRSAWINTEMGVIIRNPDLAKFFMQRIEKVIGTQAYEVYLDDDSRLRWRAREVDGREVVYRKEPETTWWERFKARIARMLPIRGQL